MASSMDEQVLRAAKEIVVKFIEVGRISPANFEETFKNVFNSIDSAVKKTNGQNNQETGTNGK